MLLRKALTLSWLNKPSAFNVFLSYLTWKLSFLWKFASDFIGFIREILLKIFCYHLVYKTWYLFAEVQIVFHLEHSYIGCFRYPEKNNNCLVNLRSFLHLVKILIFAFLAAWVVDIFRTLSSNSKLLSEAASIE